MRGIFVTGTDTGVGKTIVTGLLARYLSDKGLNVITQKWVQTGSKDYTPDTETHLGLMCEKKKDLTRYLANISPYTLKFAASPHLAASLERKKIDIKKIKRAYKELSRNFDIVIAEGAGGALVPISKKRLMIDIARELDLPVLIVTANKLGAINHTLLTVEAIKKRGMNIAGIVFNNIDAKVDDIILKDNIRIIRHITGQPVLGVLPRVRNKNLLYEKFLPVGQKVAKWING